MTQQTTHESNSLLERIAHECDAVIAAEVDRLRRRRPSLSERDLADVDDALTHLADRLLLDAIRRRPALQDAVDPIFSPLRSVGRARASAHSADSARTSRQPLRSLPSSPLWPVGRARASAHSQQRSTS